MAKSAAEIWLEHEADCKQCGGLENEYRCKFGDTLYLSAVRGQ